VHLPPKIRRSADQRRIPSHSSAVALLRALHAACRLAEQLAPAVHRAALQLLAQLAHSFFMPLCLASLAALARIQVSEPARHGCPPSSTVHSYLCTSAHASSQGGLASLGQAAAWHPRLCA
jgi:cytochrome c5